MKSQVYEKINMKFDERRIIYEDSGCNSDNFENVSITCFKNLFPLPPSFVYLFNDLLIAA